MRGSVRCWDSMPGLRTGTQSRGRRPCCRARRPARSSMARRRTPRSWSCSGRCSVPGRTSTPSGGRTRRPRSRGGLRRPVAAGRARVVHDRSTWSSPTTFSRRICGVRRRSASTRCCAVMPARCWPPTSTRAPGCWTRSPIWTRVTPMASRRRSNVPGLATVAMSGSSSMRRLLRRRPGRSARHCCARRWLRVPRWTCRATTGSSPPRTSSPRPGSGT